jgi:ABC-type polysaccharide/polyol phosphate export permease
VGEKAGRLDGKNNRKFVMIDFFSALFRFRWIIFYRTVASLRADARGLYLGYLWWFLEPVLNTVLYYCIFGLLLNSKTPSFIAYLLLGTTVFQWFQASVMGSAGTIVDRAHLYRRIPLPKFLFALIGIFSSTWKFCCVFAIVLVYIFWSTGHGSSVQMLWIPILIIVQLIVAFGLSINMAIASAYVKDFQTFSTVIFRALMFLSAIFWDVSKVPEHLEWIFFANPVASSIHCFRAPVLHDQSPSMIMLAYLLVLGFGLIQVGMIWHRHIDGQILKHIRA